MQDKTKKALSDVNSGKSLFSGLKKAVIAVTAVTVLAGGVMPGQAQAGFFDDILDNAKEQVQDGIDDAISGTIEGYRQGRQDRENAKDIQETKSKYGEAGMICTSKVKKKGTHSGGKHDVKYKTTVDTQCDDRMSARLEKQKMREDARAAKADAKFEQRLRQKAMEEELRLRALEKELEIRSKYEQPAPQENSGNVNVYVQPNTMSYDGGEPMQIEKKSPAPQKPKPQGGAFKYQ